MWTRFVRFTGSHGGAADIGGKLGKESRRSHDKAHMAVPAMPRPRFAMIEPEIGFGPLEALFYGPSQARHSCEFG